jgi:hypothetical protein
MGFSYERAKKEQENDLEPPSITIDGEEFKMVRKLGAKVAERLNRAQRGDVGAIWEALEATFIDVETYNRFIDLNLDPDDDLAPVMEGIYSQYADEVGKSQQSEQPLTSNGMHSAPTLPATTTSISQMSGSENAGQSATSEA